MRGGDRGEGGSAPRSPRPLSPAPVAARRSAGARRRRRDAGREPERRDVRRVDLVTVDGEVARLHVRLAHPQRDEEAHQLEQDERDDAGEDDHPERRERLPLEQVQPPVTEKPGGDLHRRVGEHAGQQAADEAGEAVRVDHAERVVDAPEGPHQRQVVVGGVDDDRADRADRDRAPAVHEAGRRRDRDEADDHAVDAAEQRRLAPGRVVAGDPDEEGDRGGEVRVEHRRGGVHAGVVRVAAVEAVPAEPEQAGADGDHRQVVRRVDLAVARETRPDHPGGDEARDARREMDDVAAAEVDRAVLGEPAAAPDQEGVDRVDAGRPEQDEGDPGLEVDAAEHRAEHQDRRDRREHELEVDERRLREVEHARRSSGMFPCPCRSWALSTAPGLPSRLSKKPSFDPPEGGSGGRSPC